MELIKTEVLVIGAGAAGIRAAIAATEAGAKVTLVCRGSVAESGATFSPATGGWGIQALGTQERSNQHLEGFYNDIISVGLGKCDPNLVRLLVEESGPRFDELLSWDIRFKKNTQGHFLRVKGCFSDIPRAYLTEDLQNIKQTFSRLIRRTGAVLIQGEALELIVRGNNCWGAWIVTQHQQLIGIVAQSTVLATGGGAGLFADNLSGEGDWGQGIALAHRAGASLANLEFIQFVLGLKKEGSVSFLPTSRLKNPHSLVDWSGHDILQRAIPQTTTRDQSVLDRQTHVPFSCRDLSYLVDTAVAQVREVGKKVFWGHLNAGDMEAEVSHLAHAFNGGVRIDENASTTLPGLYAAGEVAAGPHGADRIGGCMMTATQVFGARAGQFAASRAKQIATLPDKLKIPEPIEDSLKGDQSQQEDNELVAMKKQIKELASKHLMVIRNKSGLQTCLSEIDKFLSALTEIKNKKFALDLNNMICTLKLIANAALVQEASIGSHYRNDV